MSEEILEPLTIDKSKWGDGPWQNEPDRVDWVHAGLACLVLRHPRHGHYCGYVAVPESHPLYGKPHGEAAGLDFHGAINYAHACSGYVCHVPAPGMPETVWWFGGDFGHYRDISPGTNALLDEVRLPLRVREDWFRPKYRTIDYVRAEVDGLAQQLAALMPPS
jgi:hypothetical protein